MLNLAGQIVVVSVGHTEQHGLHLPLSTDTIIVQAIAEGIASAAPDGVVCLPAWPYGVSTHTRQFAGTLNLGGRVFEDFFLAIVARLVQLKAEMVFFSNAHGGNHSFLVNVVKSAGERWPEPLLRPSSCTLPVQRSSARSPSGEEWATVASSRPAICSISAPIW